MGKIIILDENTANKIAAGEVIEKPASVIKELVENSIDAGASTISVEIRNGGISFIRVTDNGTGLEEDDVEIAFERHATSKIRRADDLESIKSMGFRGEALASIAAVSDVQLTTRVRDAVQGVTIEVRGGNVVGLRPAGCPAGTTITVKELFFNTPARYKFLKKDTTEAAHVADMISRIALGYPDVSFRLTSNGSAVLHTPGNGDLKSVIFSIYGAETVKHLLKVDYNDEHAKITGYVGDAEMARSNRNQQLFYINGRTIRSRTISSALDAAYQTFLMKNKYAFAVLDIRINPSSVDVNVHPSKMEVKFSNEQDIYRAVYHAVNGALLSQSSVRTLPAPFAQSIGPEMSAYKVKSSSAGKSAYRLNEELKGKPAYSQQDFEWMRNELERKRAEAISVHSEIENASTYMDDRGEAPLVAEDGAYNTDRPKPEIYAVPAGIKATEVSERNLRQAAETPEISETSEKFTKSEESKKSGRHQELDTPDTDIAHEAEEISEAANLAVGRSNAEMFKNARIIGQIFSTYIILEGTDELFLLDQHAAHERIRYEELKKAWSKDIPFSQQLLSVINIELSATEYQFAVSETAFFSKLGFTYESFGTNSLILRSVPFTADGINISGLFMDILDFIMSGGNQDRKIIADEALYRMACKSAVKANKKLDAREIEALLSELSKLENPFTCPHGRPAILRLRRCELEKLFKRIV